MATILARPKKCHHHNLTTAPQNGHVIKSQKFFTFAFRPEMLAFFLLAYLSIPACHHQQQCSLTFLVPNQKDSLVCSCRPPPTAEVPFAVQDSWWVASRHLAGTGRSCREAQLQCTVVALTPTHCFSEEDGDTGELATGQRLYTHVCNWGGPRGICQGHNGRKKNRCAEVWTNMTGKTCSCDTSRLPCYVFCTCMLTYTNRNPNINKLSWAINYCDT